MRLDQNTLIALYILIGLYILPSIIAFVRRVRSWAPLLIVNIFFGWTILGWVGTLVWSFSPDVHHPVRHRAERLRQGGFRRLAEHSEHEQ